MVRMNRAVDDNDWIKLCCNYYSVYCMSVINVMIICD